MQAKEFLSGLPDIDSKDKATEAGIAEREAYVLKAFQDGYFIDPEWSDVHLTFHQHTATIRVTSDVLCIGTPDDWTRVTMTHTTAQHIADMFGCYLPTWRISDAVHEAASIRLRPCTQAVPPTIPDFMMSNVRMVRHHSSVEAQRNGRKGLMSTIGKEWWISNRLIHKNKAINGGWQFTGAPYKNPFTGSNLWQPEGEAHFWNYFDYSQWGPRLISSTMIVDGAERNFEEVAKDPSLFGLLNYGAPLNVFRHPAVPNDGVIYSIPNEFEDEDRMPFIQATNFTPGPRTLGPIDLIVIHAMQSPNKPSTAENVAHWFASGAAAPRASAHVCVDMDSAVRCVMDSDIAWHAPNVNHKSLGIEHAGFAEYKDSDWQTPESKSMLIRSAEIVAGWCKKHSIPIVFLDWPSLQTGKRGITTHAEVTKAFPHNSGGHWDPGSNFPIEHYIEMVQESYDKMGKCYCGDSEATPILR